jgi:PAS domain S-box-containing protein
MGKPLKVLLIEDSEDDAFLLTRKLKIDGFDPQITRVDTAEKMKLEILRDNWDVIISDFALPKFDGLSALQVHQDSKLDIPFLIVSGTIGEEVAVNAMKQGASDYLMKDKLDRLAPAIERELREVSIRRERKKAEEEIRKLSLVVIQSPSAIGITDTNGVIEYVNPKYLQITGYTQQEMIGRKSIFFDTENPLSENMKEVQKELLASNEWKGEYFNTRKNGELYWENVTINPIKDNNDTITHFLVIRDDVTKRKNMEDELIFAKEKAIQSDKLKSEFLAQMSHEIRSPINVLLSFMGLIRSEVENNMTEELNECFTVMEAAGRRIIRTIDLILNMSELQTSSYDYKPKKLNLYSEILDPIFSEYQHIAERKNLGFHIVDETVKPEIYADEYSVTQIFANLFDNALKYTEKGEINVIITSIKKKLKVEINDTGIGISEEYLPNLFKPFVQEEQGYTRKFEGNGLGLALVKKYCELNNIEISVSSKKGQGATFTLLFLE